MMSEDASCRPSIKIGVAGYVTIQLSNKDVITDNATDKSIMPRI